MEFVNLIWQHCTYNFRCSNVKTSTSVDRLSTKNILNSLKVVLYIYLYKGTYRNNDRDCEFNTLQNIQLCLKKYLITDYKMHVTCF